MGNSLNKLPIKIKGVNVRSLCYKTKSGYTVSIFFATSIPRLTEGCLIIINQGKNVDYLFVHDIDLQKNYDGVITAIIRLSRTAEQPTNDYIMIEFSEYHILKFEHNDNLAQSISNVTYS